MKIKSAALSMLLLCSTAQAGMVFWTDDYYAREKPETLGEPTVILTQEEYLLHGGSVTIRQPWSESDGSHYSGHIELSEEGVVTPVRFVRTENTFIDLVNNVEYLGFEYAHGESTCDILLTVHSEQVAGENEKAVVERCESAQFEGGVEGLDRFSGWRLAPLEDIYQITASSLGVYQSNSYGRWHWAHHFHGEGFRDLMDSLFYADYDEFYSTRDEFDYGMELRGSYSDMDRVGTYSDMVRTDVNFSMFNYDGKLASGVQVSRDSAIFVANDKNSNDHGAITILAREYVGDIPVYRLNAVSVNSPSTWGYILIAGLFLLATKRKAR